MAMAGPASLDFDFESVLLSWQDVENFLYPDSNPYESSMVHMMTGAATHSSPTAVAPSLAVTSAQSSGPLKGAGAANEVYDDLLDLDFILNNTSDSSMYPEDGTLKVKQEPMAGHDPLPDFHSAFLDIPDIKYDTLTGPVAINSRGQTGVSVVPSSGSPNGATTAATSAGLALKAGQGQTEFKPMVPKMEYQPSACTTYTGTFTVNSHFPDAYLSTHDLSPSRTHLTPGFPRTPR
ncbi:hypothetical protein C0Q70_16781 [Pomacea canaliculata]|uniref:Uncharacterized protein n=1 Tax=Pomacea canaliculata TaxID=400727 RepID=A0A2T7NQR0_POMCA|nr:hypothetical protein C0Q70_16781 [Pomacea canaliculata]